MFPRFSLAVVLYLPTCLKAQHTDHIFPRNGAGQALCGGGYGLPPLLPSGGHGCLVLGSSGPLDIQSLGVNTQINGEGNGHPTPTQQPPKGTVTPLPTHKQTDDQQQIRPTATADSRKSSRTPSAFGYQPSANTLQSSQITASLVEASNSDGNPQSLTQEPSPSPSVGGTLQRHGTSKSRIIAAILGSILGVIIIVAAVLLIRYRRRRHATSKLKDLIATPWEQEREPSIYDPRYQINRGFDHFNHTHQPNGGGIERHLSMVPYSFSSFSLTSSGDTVMEEKLNFRLDHPL